MDEQLLLIEPPFHEKYRNILIGVASFVVIALLVVFFYITKSKRDIVRFIPKDSHFFAAIHVDESIVETSLYQKLNLPADVKAVFSSAIAQDFDKESRYNFGYGKVPTSQGISEIFIIITQNKLDPTNKLYVTSKQLGYTAFSLQTGIQDKNYSIFAKDPEVVAKISDVISKKLPGLDADISFAVDRHKVWGGDGFVYISHEGVEQFQKLIPDEFNLDLLRGSQTYGFSIDPIGITIKTDGYDGTLPAQVPSSDSFVRSMELHVTSNDKIKLLELANKITSPHIVDNLGISFKNMIENLDVLQYFQYEGNNAKYNLQFTGSVDATKNVLRFVEQYLRSKYPQDTTIALPDTTPVRVKTLNRDQVTIDGSKVSYLDQDIFVVGQNDGTVTVVRNTVDEPEEKVELGYCFLSPKADTYTTRLTPEVSEKYFGGIFDFAVFSTYPHTYPQFVLCLN